MNTKNIVSTLLLVFVGLSIAYMVASEKKGDDAIVADAVETSQSDGLVVYYFYGDKRCVTCTKLEGYANEALTTYFPGQLASGEIEWKPVNTDLPENSHFVTDYELVTKSVILSKVKGGKEVSWTNLLDIWKKVGDKADYIDYIKVNVAGLLEGQD
jgi:hypothetical protein